MSQIKNQMINADIQLKAIELLSNSITPPSISEVPLVNFNFNINIESKVDHLKKLLFIIVHVEIKCENQKYQLGSISVSCVYSIANFEEVVKIESDGRINIPQTLFETLNSISISTTRGVMYSTFKGTFLHNAFLPIVNPRGFQLKETEAT
jgi:hypothetical protein